MKKKVIVLLGISLALSLASCGGNSDKQTDSENAESTENSSINEVEVSEMVETESKAEEPSEEPSEEESSSEAEETIYNVGETALLKDWEVIVTNMQIVDSVSSNYLVFNPNDEGNKYAQVFVTVNNKGKQSDRFLPSFGYGDDVNAKLLYGDGYEFSATQLLGYDNDLHDSSINPLSSQEGEIMFEIPEVVASSTDELIIRFSSGNDVINFKVR